MVRFIRFLWRLLKTVVVLGVLAVIVAMILPVEMNLTEQSQYPSLPNGCEAVSASVALNGLGVPIAAETFASQYLPKVPIGTSAPSQAYQGDPFGDGYYCYPKALATGINSFLTTQSTSLQAKTHPLVPFSEVLFRLHTKKPVIVWTTADDKFPERDPAVIWQNGLRDQHPYMNLHVVVIDGVRGFNVHLVDSLNGARWMSVFKFIPLYYSMGLRAVYFAD